MPRNPHGHPPNGSAPNCAALCSPPSTIVNGRPQDPHHQGTHHPLDPRSLNAHQPGINDCPPPTRAHQPPYSLQYNRQTSVESQPPNAHPQPSAHPHLYLHEYPIAHDALLHAPLFTPANARHAHPPHIPANPAPGYPAPPTNLSPSYSGQPRPTGTMQPPPVQTTRTPRTLTTNPPVPAQRGVVKSPPKPQHLHLVAQHQGLSVFALLARQREIDRQRQAAQQVASQGKANEKSVGGLVHPVPRRIPYKHTVERLERMASEEANLGPEVLQRAAKAEVAPPYRASGLRGRMVVLKEAAEAREWVKAEPRSPTTNGDASNARNGTEPATTNGAATAAAKEKAPQPAMATTQPAPQARPARFRRPSGILLSQGVVHPRRSPQHCTSNTSRPCSPPKPKGAQCSAQQLETALHASARWDGNVAHAGRDTLAVEARVAHAFVEQAQSPHSPAFQAWASQMHAGEFANHDAQRLALQIPAVQAHAARACAQQAAQTHRAVPPAPEQLAHAQTRADCVFEIQSAQRAAAQPAPQNDAAQIQAAFAQLEAIQGPWDAPPVLPAAAPLATPAAPAQTAPHDEIALPIVAHGMTQSDEAEEWRFHRECVRLLEECEPSKADDAHLVDTVRGRAMEAGPAPPPTPRTVGYLVREETAETEQPPKRPKREVS